MGDSDSSSSGTPSPRTLLRRRYEVAQDHPSTSAAHDTPREQSLDPSMSSEDEPALGWTDRCACWCTGCRGYVMRQYRIVLRHEEATGRCADAPLGSRSPRRATLEEIRHHSRDSSSSPEPDLPDRSRMTRHRRSIAQIQRHAASSSSSSSAIGGIDRETHGDLPLPSSLRCHLRSYDRTIFGTWSDDTPIPEIGDPFTFWGRSYMIAGSSIRAAGIGLFTIDGIFVPPESSVTLMVFAGPEYTWGQWHQLSQYSISMATYGICSNGASLALRRDDGLPVTLADRLYIDGRPYTNGNIAGFINSSRGVDHRTNCIFEERTSVQEEYMSCIVDRCVMVVATTTIPPSSELFANYSFIRRTPARIARQAAGLPIHVPRRHRDL